MIPATLAVLTWALLLQLTEGGCPETRPTKQILCYLEHVTPHFDPCVCTHLVLQSTIDKLTPQSELLKSAKLLQEQNPSLKLVGVASDSAESALKRRDAFAKSVANVVNKCELDGVEVSLRWGAKVPGKVQLVDFIKSLSKEFKRLDPLQRSKRSYSIFEQTDDEESKPRWSPPQHREQKQRRTRESDDEPTVRRIKKTDDAATSPPEDISNEEKEGDKTNEAVTNRREIIVKLPADPQVLAKNYDLKRLSKYIDFYTLASDNFTDVSEEGLTFHPSRLMGIEDILNADSLVDLLTGLGAPHDKLVMAMPGTALKFTLADSKKNMPRSPTTGEPETISQSELCALMSEGTWTVERDEDLTAPYAFRKKTWIAFDDRISVSIKGKYILLRDLAGGAVASADAEDWSGKCNTTGIARTLYDTFTTIARKPREAQLVSLQEQLHESSQFSAYSGDIQLSPYRIVRVVDRQGAIHVVRKEAKTEFECSRQGYFRHPNGCNRFYRCVKFNQYSSDFTVFEYDCPAGLAFDERWEVCVWPGSLPDGGACQGSSEIAPVPRERFVCPRVEGYYADPENCRWFFACLDHIRDGVTALTAYEFRCPFGLVFNEKLLICDWPWLVEGCGGIGIFRARFTVGDFLEGRQRASYAQLSDVHVSGGRIENVNGGVVLGSLAGLGGAGSYASGSHILATGAAAADGYAGGAGGYGAGGLIAGYAGESGAAYSGAAGGHGVAGGYAGAGAGGAAGYVAGVGDGGVTYVSGVGAGGAHTGESTLLYTGGDKYAAGTGVYSPGTGGALLGAGKSVYAAGGLGVGVHGGQATLLSGGGEYSGVAAGYAGESGTAYTGTGGAGYVAGGAGAGKSTLLYSGKLAGSALGSGIGYAVGDDSGLYSAGGYEGGKSSLVYTTGGSAGHGLASGIAFGGTTLAVDHGADSVVTTAADADAYLNEAAGVAAFEANKFGGAAVVHQPVSSVSYHGSFGQKTAVPVTLVSDAISSGNGGFDAVHTVSKPAVVSNLYNVKVTPASDAIVTGLGGHLSSGYVSSTVAPVGVVTATPAPIAISTYTTPRPKTYYPVESIGFTPAPITTYHRPLASVTAAPITTYHRPLFSPTVTPTVDVDFKYQQPIVKTVTPVHPVAAVHYPTVLKTPVVPLNPVQYSTPAPAVSIHYSTPAPTVVSTLQPAISTGAQYTYQKTSVPLQPIHYSTPAVEYSTPRPFARPVIPTVLKTPVVPLSPIQYPTTVAPTEIHYTTPKPVSVVQPVSYTFQKPTVQYSTPAPAVTFEYSTPRPFVRPVPHVVQPVHHVVQPVQPVVQPVHRVVQPVQPVVQPFQHVVQPVHRVVQPLQPVVQPVQHIVQPVHRIVQPVQPVVQPFHRIVQPVQPVVQPVQHIVQPVQPVVQPVQHLVQPISYSYRKPVVPAVLKTPVVPLNPVQYSTTVAPFDLHYSTPSPVPVVQPVSPVTYTYQKPVVPLKPITYTTPAPAVSLEYSTPRPFVKTFQPFVSYSYQKPVVPTVLKTPVVPLNTIQYSTTVAPEIDLHYSTPKIPVVQPVSYTYQKPVLPLKPIQYAAPAPAVPVTYSTPRPILQPLQPAVSYTYQKPVIPTVYKTPIVPLNPVQYSTTVAPFDIHYSTPKPVPVVHPLPSVSYTYKKPVVPVTYTTPAPTVDFEYSAPKIYGQSVQSFGGYYYQKPVIPTVLKTPVVPLNTIQYSTTVAPAVDLHYSTPKPVPVVQPVSPVTYTYQKPLKPIVYTTPAPVPVSVEYSTPKPFVQPVQPVFSYSYQKPVVPTVYKTPVVPLNPVQYSTTVAPVDIHYSTPKPVPVVHPLPSVSYTYQKPVVPVQPITYTTPAPVIAVQPEQPVVGYSYPKPALSYSYPKPVIPTVFKTPVVPLNTIQYSTTVAPAVDLHYYTPKPVPVVQPVSPLTYTYQKPVVPLKPILYTTPAPAVSLEYATPRPYVQPVVSYQKPVIPTVLKTPVVPLNTIQYSTTVAPAVDLHYSVPQPAVTYTYQKPSFRVRPQVPVVPTVLKTPAVPLSPIQYTTPAPVLDYSYQGPVISSVKFGHGYERPLVYSTPKPAVAVTPTVVTSTTVVPDVHYTPMYQRVIDAFKTPVVSAYEKVLNVISGTSTPAPIVTHSPVSYAPVDVGYSYKKPAVVKTPSIPVTPVTVVPAYQKVLNVVKATTTPAPVYVNHYTSTTPVPDLVSYHEEEGTGFGIDQQDYQAQLDLYQSLKSEFGSKLQTYQHTSNEFQGYEYERPQVRFEEGAVYQKNIVPQYYQSTTTVAPVVAVKQGYDAGASLGGYKQDVYYSVQKPVLPVVKQYQHTSNEFQGYAYERPQVRFEEGAVYQKNIVPQYYQSTTTVAPVVAVKQGYDAGASLGGYKQDVYYSVQKPVLPVVKQYLQEVVPTTVVSSTPIPDFDVTTARVSLPVVKKVNLRPYVTTTTAYPTTVFTPSTAFTPSYYTSTPAPAVTISTAAPHPDDVVDVEGEEGYEENEGALLEAYNGHFGGLLSKGAVETHLAAGVSSTVASIADGETIVGVLKKGKITYNGKRTKSKVVVVSRLSDFNPILVGKLGAECSCRSNTLNLRRGKVLPSNNELFAPNTYGDDYSASGLPELSNTYLPSTTTVSPLPVVSLGDDDLGDKLGLHANVDPVVEIRPSGKLVTTTTVLPSVVNGDPYSKVTVVPTVAYEQPSSYVPVSYVTDRTPRPTYQDVLLGSSISAAEIDGEARVRPGKAFDRYGPGGWRSLDETLQGSVDCKRAGLFRHPKYCNKFYACNWDQWKGRFTLHVFNCPVHLAYDQKIGACNWPSKGPACADDNLLV